MKRIPTLPLLCFFFFSTGFSAFALTKNVVSDYGADTKNADNTAIFNKAIEECRVNKWVLYIPGGTYQFRGALVKGEDFYCPDIIGESPETTILSWSGAISFFVPNLGRGGSGDTKQGNMGEAGLHIQGGSGGLAHATIANLTFVGNGNGIGIQISDQNGVVIKNCVFKSFDTAGEFLNLGGFTEFVVFQECHFYGSADSGLKRVISYRRLKLSGGTDSFNGSGIRDCVINDYNFSGTVPFWELITIGPNCLVYNAPLSFSAWTSNVVTRAKSMGGFPQRIIVRNYSALPATFYGRIALEPGGPVYLGVRAPGPIYLAGSYMALNSPFSIEPFGMEIVSKYP